MKNGERYPELKRYEIGRYTFGIPTEAPEGAWVKYNDVWTLDNNIFILKKLNFDLSLENKKLQETIKDLDKRLKEEQDWNY